MKVITITTQGTAQKLIKRLNRVRNQQPVKGRRVLERFGRELEFRMRESALQAGITPFTSKGLDKIRWKQRPRANRGALFIPWYMIELDERKPHIKGMSQQHTPRLVHWASIKGNIRLRSAATRMLGGSNEVVKVRMHQHPFISNGWHRARRSLSRIKREESRRV